MAKALSMNELGTSGDKALTGYSVSFSERQAIQQDKSGISSSDSHKKSLASNNAPATSDHERPSVFPKALFAAHQDPKNCNISPEDILKPEITVTVLSPKSSIKESPRATSPKSPNSSASSPTSDFPDVPANYVPFEPICVLESVAPDPPMVSGDSLPTIRLCADSYEDDNDEMTCCIVYPKFVRRSYGNERRYFCPPPYVCLNGEKWKKLQSVYSGASEDSQLCALIGVETTDNTTPHCIEHFRGTHCYATDLYIRDAERRKNITIFSEIRFESGEKIAVIRSKDVSLASSPARRELKKYNELCIPAGSHVAIFNRSFCQTENTKYLRVVNREIQASNIQWGTFTIHILASPETDTQDYALKEGHVHFGSTVLLVCAETDIALPKVVLHKVDKQTVMMDAQDPVTQMHKCAFYLKDSDCTFLALEGNTVSNSKGTPWAGDPNQISLAKNAVWNIVTTEKVEYTVSEEFGHQRFEVTVKGEPLIQECGMYTLESTTSGKSSSHSPSPQDFPHMFLPSSKKPGSRPPRDDLNKSAKRFKSNDPVPVSLAENQSPTSSLVAFKQSSSDNEMKLLFLYPKYTCKSYGNQKRYFCPPPLICIEGSRWKTINSKAEYSGTPEEGRQLCAIIGVDNFEHEYHCIEFGNKTSCIAKEVYIKDFGKRRAISLAMKLWFQSGEYIGTVQSKEIFLISKPDKTVKKPIDTGFFGFFHLSQVAIISRTFSQNSNIRYLHAEEGTIQACTSCWGSFTIHLLQHPEIEDPSIQENQIHFGSTVLLVCSSTGIALPSVVIYKVDKQTVLMDSTEPVCQMHKVAFLIKNSDSMFICISDSKLIEYKGVSCPDDPKKMLLTGCAVWLVVNTEQLEFSISEESGPSRFKVSLTKQMAKENAILEEALRRSTPKPNQDGQERNASVVAPKNENNEHLLPHESPPSPKPDKPPDNKSRSQLTKEPTVYGKRLNKPNFPTGKDEAFVELFYPRFVLRSYGSERRYFCPPPLVHLAGNGWNTYQDCCFEKDDYLRALIGVENCDQSFQRLSFFEWNNCVAKTLYIRDSSKKKSFTLCLKMKYENGDNIGIFRSKEIMVITKPARRGGVKKYNELCVNSGSKVALYNRTLSQSGNTKYLFVHNGEIQTSSTRWGAFTIHLVESPAPDGESYAVKDGHIHFGSTVLLVCTETGMALPTVVIQRVDEQIVTLDAQDPVCQMHKCAFYIKNSDWMYLCLSSNTLIEFKATVCAKNPRKVLITSSATWVIIGTDKLVFKALPRRKGLPPPEKMQRDTSPEPVRERSPEPPAKKSLPMPVKKSSVTIPRVTTPRPVPVSVKKSAEPVPCISSFQEGDEPNDLIIPDLLPEPESEREPTPPQPQSSEEHRLVIPKREPDVVNPRHSLQDVLNKRQPYFKKYPEDSSSTAVIFLCPKFAQKSYPYEKRFLVPPPCVYLLGGWKKRLLEMVDKGELKPGTRLCASLCTDEGEATKQLMDFNGKDYFSCKSMPVTDLEKSSLTLSAEIMYSDKKDVGVFSSNEINIISKPVQQKKHLCISSGSLVALANCQPTESQYLVAENGQFKTSSMKWSIFSVHLMNDDSDSEQLLDNNTNICYGSKVKLLCTLTGMELPVVIIHKVDKQNIVLLDADGPVTQMCKCAVYIYGTDKMYLCPSVDKLAQFQASSYPKDPTKEIIIDEASWTIMSADISEYNTRSSDGTLKTQSSTDFVQVKTEPQETASD